MISGRTAAHQRLTRGVTPVGQQDELGAQRRAIEALIAGLPAVGRYRLTLRARDALSLPAYSGSALRGVFGHGLREVACVMRSRPCAGCPLVGRCAYPLLFETPAGPADAAAGAQVPHPLVLVLPWQVPRSLAAGEDLELSLHLFGPANRLLPTVVEAWRAAAVRGLGASRGRLELRDVAQWRFDEQRWSEPLATGTSAGREAVRAPALPPCPARVRLECVTPLRLKRAGRLVRPEGLDARQLVTALLRRSAALARHYGAGPLSLPPDLAAVLARHLALVPEGLRWADWGRYSSRQRASMQMGGLLGSLVLSGDALPVLWPLLHHGQWLHLGKGTSFGLGRYALRRAASLRTPTSLPAS
jgi:hypothetical protein